MCDHKNYQPDCKDCLALIKEELSYAIEDGRLDAREAMKLIKHPTQAISWVKKYSGYDPY